jgi:hypothetical protein
MIPRRVGTHNASSEGRRPNPHEYRGRRRLGLVLHVCVVGVEKGAEVVVAGSRGGGQQNAIIGAPASRSKKTVADLGNGRRLGCLLHLPPSLPLGSLLTREGEGRRWGGKPRPLPAARSEGDEAVGGWVPAARETGGGGRRRSVSIGRGGEGCESKEGFLFFLIDWIGLDWIGLDLMTWEIDEGIWWLVNCVRAMAHGLPISHWSIPCATDPYPSSRPFRCLEIPSDGWHRILLLSYFLLPFHWSTALCRGLIPHTKSIVAVRSDPTGRRCHGPHIFGPSHSFIII